MKYRIDGKKILICFGIIALPFIFHGPAQTIAHQALAWVPVAAAIVLVGRRFDHATLPFSTRDNRARAGWRRIAAALVLMQLGGLASDLGPLLGGAKAVTAIAHCLVLLACVALAWGVIRLARLSPTVRTSEVLLDGAAIGLTALASAWEFLFNSLSSGSFADDLSAWTYPIGSAVLLCTAAWLTLLPGRDCHAARFLVTFFAWICVLGIVSSRLNGLQTFDGSFKLAPFGYWLVVLALATSDRAALDSPDSIDDTPFRARHFALVALPLLIAPVVAIEHAYSKAAHRVALGTISLLVVCLVLLRFWILLRRTQAQHQELTFQAQHDGLTGLLNRSAYVQRLQDLLASPVKTPGAIVWAIFLDLDHFKNINDEFGHRHGDAVLRVVSKRLEQVSPSAMVARLGVDEFALAFEATRHKALEITQLVVDLLGLPFETDGATFGREQRTEPSSPVFHNRASDVVKKAHLLFHPSVKHQLGVSVGLAGVASGSTNSSELLSRADRAMYRAKQSGGSQWVEFDEALQRELDGHRELELALERAVTANDIEVAYQPIFDVESLGIIGFEALARWRSDEYGLVSPDFFIQLAERSALIHRLGLNVLDHSLRELANWNTQRGDQALSLSVNVSSRQFESPAFVHDIVERLMLSGVAPQQVILEITERLLMDDIEATLGILRELRSQGIRVAVDDFGIGYSSLAYLETFPIDVLKIDRALINRVTGDTSSVSVVSASIDLGHALGMKVTAEGVEREEQIFGLRKMGCDAAQGYYLGHPLTATEALLLVVEPTRKHSSRT